MSFSLTKRRGRRRRQLQFHKHWKYPDRLMRRQLPSSNFNFVNSSLTLRSSPSSLPYILSNSKLSSSSSICTVVYSESFSRYARKNSIYLTFDDVKIHNFDIDTDANQAKDKERDKDKTIADQMEQQQPQTQVVPIELINRNILDSILEININSNNRIRRLCQHFQHEIAGLLLLLWDISYKFNNNNRNKNYGLKSFGCVANYSGDNLEFGSLLKKILTRTNSSSAAPAVCLAPFQQQKPNSTTETISATVVVVTIRQHQLKYKTLILCLKSIHNNDGHHQNFVLSSDVTRILIPNRMLLSNSCCCYFLKEQQHKYSEEYCAEQHDTDICKLLQSAATTDAVACSLCPLLSDFHYYQKAYSLHLNTATILDESDAYLIPRPLHLSKHRFESAYRTQHISADSSTNCSKLIETTTTTTKSPSTISSNHLLPVGHSSSMSLSPQYWDQLPQLAHFTHTPSLSSINSQIEPITASSSSSLATISTHSSDFSQVNVATYPHHHHNQQPTNIAQSSSLLSSSVLPCFPYSLLQFSASFGNCNSSSTTSSGSRIPNNGSCVKQAEQTQLSKPLLPLLSTLSLASLNNNNNINNNTHSFKLLADLILLLCLSLRSPISLFKFTFASTPSTSTHNKCTSSSFSSSSSYLRTLYCLVLTLLTVLSVSGPNFVLADRNRFYHISALCLRERVHPVYKKIDGAVITSKSENNLDCTITFQTDTILQRFMLRFEKLALDCNDHLYIYDGAHTIGNHKADLSCRSTRAEVGTIYTQSNFLTLRYTTDAYSIADNGFRLIITAYKESKNYCREHRCSNQFCISRDLICDGVNHCSDNSDESYYANCQAEYEEADTIIGLDPLLFVAIVSSVFVSCLVCVISVSVCLCRRERLLQRQQQRIALQQQYQGHQLLEQHQGTTPILGHNNNSYTSKLDGACTMITSLDGYGATRNGGIVNSFTHTALPNHNNNNNFATMPHLHNHNHHMVGNHNNNSQAIGQLAAGAGLQLQQQLQQHQNHLQHQQQQQQASHVRFGTLPVRGNEKPPPPYPGNNFNNNTGNHNHSLSNIQQNNINASNNGGAVALGNHVGNHVGNHLASNLINNSSAQAAAAAVSNGNGINLAIASGAGATPPHSSSQQSAVVKPVQTQVIYTAK